MPDCYHGGEYQLSFIIFPNLVPHSVSSRYIDLSIWRLSGAVILSIIFLCLQATIANAKQGGSSNIKGPVEEITDAKEFKKLLRTKNNVLVLFVSTTKRTYFTTRMFKEAAEAVKGQGTLAFVDCYG